MRHRYDWWLAAFLLATWLGLLSSNAQEATELDRIRKQRVDAADSLTQKQRELDLVLQKQRAEFEQKLKVMEQDLRDAFNQKHAMAMKQLLELQQLEKSIEKKIEAKEKNFYARVEIKGKLHRSNGSDSIPPMPRFKLDRIITAGEIQHKLIIAGAGREALRELADNNHNRTVIITGDLTANGVMVRTLAPVDD